MSQWSTQKSTISYAGRSVHAFRELTRCLREAGPSRPRLLSFGCSEGYEPSDLKAMVPDAEVLGCDVNAKALAEAVKRCEPAGIRIFESSAEAVAAHGPYDAITAMNVLTRYPEVRDRPDISAIYPFAAFDHTLSTFFDALRPGGFLLIFNATYPVELASAADRLEPVATPDFPALNGWVDKYDRDSRRLTKAVGEFYGALLPIPEWRAALVQESRKRTDWEVMEVWPCRHEPVDATVPTPDLKTILWRRTDRPA